MVRFCSALFCSVINPYFYLKCLIVLCYDYCHDHCYCFISICKNRILASTIANATKWRGPGGKKHFLLVLQPHPFLWFIVVPLLFICIPCPHPEHVDLRCFARIFLSSLHFILSARFFLLFLNSSYIFYTWLSLRKSPCNWGKGRKRNRDQSQGPSSSQSPFEPLQTKDYDVATWKRMYCVFLLNSGVTRQLFLYAPTLMLECSVDSRLLTVDCRLSLCPF